MGEPDNRNHLRHRDDASHHQLQENLPIPSEHAGVTLSCGAGPEADHNGLPSAGRQTSCLTTAALLEDAGMSHKPILERDRLAFSGQSPTAVGIPLPEHFA